MLLIVAHDAKRLIERWATVLEPGRHVVHRIDPVLSRSASWIDGSGAARWP